MRMWWQDATFTGRLDGRLEACRHRLLACFSRLPMVLPPAAREQFQEVAGNRIEAINTVSH
jgi:hypothetical protein